MMLNNVMQHHSGVLLEPATAGQLPLQQPITSPASLSPTAAVDKKPVASKVLRDIASTSMSSKFVRSETGVFSKILLITEWVCVTIHV